MEKEEEKILKEDNIKIEEQEEVTDKETKTENTEKEHVANIEDDKSKNIKEEKNYKVKSKHEEEKKFSAKMIISICIAIIFIIFISTIFAIINMGNKKIVQGIFIEDVNISNLSKEELTNLVNSKTSKIESVELSYGEYETIVKLEEIGVKINSKEVIKSALNFGKTNNIIIDNYQILFAKLFEEHLDLVININQEKFDEMVKNIQAEIPEAIKEYSYEIKDEELIITNGKAGEKILQEDLKQSILLNIKEQFNGNVETIKISTKSSNPLKVDIKKIYNDIYKEAKNAYIVEDDNKEIFDFYKEENGIDFAISIKEAEELLKEKKETYIIPLKITKPEVTVKDLGDKLFKQSLSKYTTIYDAGNANRSHNIALAAKTINGTIVMPGETFSYNGILGNTNKEKGYKLGTAYVGGKVVESYGGGICQVSSTLYNSALYANLEIVERYNHSYVVSYVPAGRDATVAYGGKDFKFKNNRTYPIRIDASAKNGVVSISIKGIKEDTDYEVVLTSSVLSTTPRSVIYENNSEMDEGTQKVIQKGYDGKKSIAYKILKNKDGSIYSKTVLSKDTYKPMTQIIQVGTKKVIIPTDPTIQTNTDTIQNAQPNIENPGIIDTSANNPNM